MKYRDLIKELQRLGWYKISDKGKHEKWSNGEQAQPVPRHREINEFTARGILKFARNNPPAESENDK